MCKLRYDGKYADVAGQPRQWTILSHFIGPDGGDYFRSSRMLEGLQQLGIIEGDKSHEIC